MGDLLASLNNKQREAVTAPMGPVLVLAGAGSGKTRVLTYRIAHLLREKLFGPDEILALTFTNKAAGEMKQRVYSILNIEYGVPHFNLTMGTFHSVCARILRQDIAKLKLGYDPNFIIYDTDDALTLIKQVVMEKGLSDKIRPQVFAYYISQAKNRLVHPSELDLDNSFFAETLQEIYEEYQRRLYQHNALDFDDLLQLACELFKNKGVLNKYQDRFKYVLVDEYQDTNHAQYVLLKLLVEKNRNIFVVGDDAQSIYGFRGANMQNILDFSRDYPDAKVIMLEQNYRSTQNILDAASKIIRLNTFQYEKKLWTENAGGQKIQLYEARDETDEAEFVVERILNHNAPFAPSYLKRGEGELVYESEETPIFNRLLKNKGVSRIPIQNTTYQIPDTLNDFVVLYRTHAQSRAFEEALLKTGIPYQIVGGIKFYERKEIKDVLAYLRLILNPRDLVSLSRVINQPPRGIGRAAFREISKVLPKYDYSFLRILRNLDEVDLQNRAISGAKDFFNTMIQALKLQKTKSILGLMRLLVVRSGYKDSILDGSLEGQTRWENIEELFNVAAKYQKKPWEEGLPSFLEEVALMTDLDNMEVESDKLTLMTLHSAKGLEFENVFFVGLEEGLLPHSRSFNSPEELAEEIRLAYVGMTRAKKNLFLSYAKTRQSYGELKRAVPSRIIKAIPNSLLHKLN